MIEQLMNIAEINVSYKPAVIFDNDILTSFDAYRLFMKFFPESTMHLQERFMVMYLNKANKVLGIYPMSVGGITGTVADIRIILSVALKAVATTILLAHNHPSGNMKPSQKDLELTHRIKEAASMLDIKVVDHLIISPADDVYFSFADEGFL